MEDNLQEKTYSQSEVDELLQKEADRRVTAALAKQEKKMREAQQLEAMSSQEKFEYLLKQKEAELEEREKALTRAELKNSAGKILADKGLSLDFIDFVLDDDAEKTNARITQLEKTFKKAVSDEITKRIGGQAPQRADGEKGMTREQFNKLSLKEQQKLANENRALYDALTKG